MNSIDSPSKRLVNPWPIAIIIYFVCFGSAVVGFAIFAMRQPNDLVAANYYDQEIRYQKQVDRLNRTAPLRSQIAVTYEPQTRFITVKLPASHHEAQGSIRLYRPSDARADTQLNLAVDEHATQSVPAGNLQPGRWRVCLNWLVDGAEYYFDDIVVIESQPGLNGAL